MTAPEVDNYGYVYILKVKDFDFPVCKIGMTTRTPYIRCDEINNNSAGDFILSVVYYMAVDNFRDLERLIHIELSERRQSGRDIFNLSADEASVRLDEGLEEQHEIKRVFG